MTMITTKIETEEDMDTPGTQTWQAIVKLQQKGRKEKINKLKCWGRIRDRRRGNLSRKWLSDKVYHFKVYNKLTKFTCHKLYNNILYMPHIPYKKMATFVKCKVGIGATETGLMTTSRGL